MIGAARLAKAASRPAGRRRRANGARPCRGEAGSTARPIRGRSWAAWLRGAARAVYGAADPVGAELFGGRSLRQGEWKLLDRGDGQWRLFNIAHDPGETQDLSAREPRRRADLVKAHDAYAAEVGVIPPEPRHAAVLK